MTENAQPSVWLVLTFNRIAELDNQETLSHVEVHATEASANAAADASLSKTAGKATAKAGKVSVTDENENDFDSLQSSSWSLKEGRAKVRVQILQKVIENNESAPSANKQCKGLSKRKAEDGSKEPKESKAAKLSDNEAEDANPKQSTTAVKKAATRKNTSTMTDGKPDCLRDVKLLFTGTFDSMDRKGCIDTAERYGGTVVKKLEDADYVVLGVKAGPKKLKEIEQLKLHTLNEQAFLDILQTGELP